jgi:hypothetical protein
MSLFKKKYFLVSVCYYKFNANHVTYMDVMRDEFPDRDDIRWAIEKRHVLSSDFTIPNIVRLSKKEYEKLRVKPS